MKSVNIGDKVKSLETDKIETVLDKTSNSIRITQQKTSAEGIDCDSWFTDKDFEKKFKTLKPTP